MLAVNGESTLPVVRWPLGAVFLKKRSSHSKGDDEEVLRELELGHSLIHLDYQTVVPSLSGGESQWLRLEFKIGHMNGP